MRDFKPLHRPLTATELDARAVEFDRPGEPRPVSLSLDLVSPSRPEPRVTVRGDQNNWRVEIDFAEAKAARRLGLTSESVPRPPLGTVVPHQLDGLIPTGAAVRVKPRTQELVEKQIRLRGRKGGYTPLDARRLLTDQSWPWRLTGKVTNSDGFFGSGVLVGERLMLTAHHMRPVSGLAAGSWWMKFSPHFDSADMPVEPFGESNVSDLRAYSTDGDSTEYTVSHDFMLCRLYEPLGQNLGYLGATSYSGDWDGLQVWQNIGYPIDVGGGSQPAVQFNQSMIDDDNDDGGQIVETNATLNHGNSGGPFFSWFTDGDVKLCGVVSGALTGAINANGLAGGDEMVDLIKWGRTNWPA